MEAQDKKELIQKIDTVLDEIRPHLRIDGGDIEVVDVSDDMDISLRFLGNCQSCSLSDMTMSIGVEQAIRKRIENVKSIKSVPATIPHE